MTQKGYIQKDRQSLSGECKQKESWVGNINIRSSRLKGKKKRHEIGQKVLFNVDKGYKPQRRHKHHELFLC